MGTITLDIFVSDIANILHSYDVMKIRRSIDGATGSYIEMTGKTATSAALVSSQRSSFDVVSKALRLAIDHTEPVTVVFAGPAPLTPGQTAAEINIIIPRLASAEDGYITLTSSLTGSVSVVEAVEGSALSEFGWAEGELSVGLEEYIPLTPGQTDYTFIDRDGDSAYFYEAALYNTTTQLTSTWSDPFKGGTGIIISAQNMSLGSVSMVDAAGIAVVGQRITFYSEHVPLKIEGYQAAMVRHPITVETDNDGYAEISLVRGLRLKVVFEGTSYIREITVPDQESFDILDLMSTVADPFNPVEPFVVSAIRRSL